MVADDRITHFLALYKQSIKIVKMKQKDNGNKAIIGEPVLDFISGRTDTVASRRLTRRICNVQSLWQLAKMTETVKKYGRY